MRAIPLPQTADHLDAIPSDVWNRFHAMYMDDQQESYGHLGFATADPEKYRSNMAVKNEEADVVYWVLINDGSVDVSVVEESWDGVEPSDLVGFMSLEMPRHDNHDLAHPGLYIDPVHRRQGYGTAAIAFLRDYGLERGRVKQEAWTKVPREATGAVLKARNGTGAVSADHYLVAFMDSVGFGLDMVEKSSSINLAEKREHLATLPHALPDGYTVEIVRGMGDPHETAEMWNRFAQDVPRSEDTEPETYTAERVVTLMNNQKAKGWHDVTAVVRHEGKIVAYSTVSFKGGGRVGYQEGTWVDAAHRGKSLSLHAKVANYLDLLGTDLLDEVQTENAEDNAAMWAVNDKLGFEISSSEGDWTCRFNEGVWGPI